MKFFKFIILFFGLLSFFSCSKSIDLLPTDTFTDANAFRTISDAQMAVNEAYSRYGTYTNMMYTSALLSDEAKLGYDNAGQGALTYRFQYASDATTGGDVTAAYGGFYYMIDQVNRTLDKLPSVIAAAGEEPRRPILKGQLLALRAIAHFSLLQAYCKNYSPSEKGIAVMTSYDAYARPSRSTMLESITQIEKDLSDAYALLPAVTSSTFSDTVMNQVNIDAYRARIALYKGDYQAAITYASNVINSGVKSLASGANYSGIWTDANTNEILFRIRYATGTSVGALWTTTSGLIYVAPSDKLIATYSSSDVRKASFIAGSSGKYYVNKFYTSSKGGRVLDLKACRLSEMYLIRAEASAKLSTPDITTGTSDLNTLRGQRITGYTPVTFSTATDLISAVLDERYKELCFEGFRFWDLKRNNLALQRNASDVTSSTWQTLAASDYKWILPIPQYEILANPNMTQNSGY